MSLSGDELRDLKLDEDRTVSTGADGDLELTGGIETVEQSVGISGGAVLRPLVGEPVNAETFSDIESELQTVLERDPQIEAVNRVEVFEVDRSVGEVSVRVFTEYNNSFELNLDAQ